MTPTPPADMVGKLLLTIPADLRWAAGQLSAPGNPEWHARGADLAALADRVDATLEAGSEGGKCRLLAEVAPEMRWAAETLSGTGARDVCHRANNLLQASENAEFIVSRIAVA
jgi:hypothetical protein